MTTTERITTYEVFAPATNGPERYRTGATITTHHSPEAAARRLRADNDRLHRTPGGAGSWLDRDLRARDAAGYRPLSESEQEAIDHDRMTQEG